MSKAIELVVRYVDEHGVQVESMVEVDEAAVAIAAPKLGYQPQISPDLTEAIEAQQLKVLQAPRASNARTVAESELRELENAQGVTVPNPIPAHVHCVKAILGQLQKLTVDNEAVKARVAQAQAEALQEQQAAVADRLKVTAVEVDPEPVIVDPGE